MNWKKILSQNITAIEDLNLSSASIDLLEKDTSFSLNIPKRLAEKISKNPLKDPIALQFLPMKQEALIHTSFCNDPLSESNFKKTSKLLYKYQKRALLITTNACAMHCRFCFRRWFEHTKENTDFDKEIEWLRQHHEIEEVILSGGDPLSLPDSTLEKLFHALSSIPHIKIMRIHTRFPIGIPERIDDSFLSCLAACKLQKVFVLHVNHPLELDEDVQEKMHLLHSQGVLLLSQTVLLKGVNDTALLLEELMKRLISCRILPYYLHQLDRVQGTSHFEVPIEKGKHLMATLRENLPGYCIPRYVQETPFDRSKTPIF
jgi:EF-P beta-lysylation protein EpmB